MTVVRRLARPLLATIFVTGGLDSLRHPTRHTEKAAPVVGMLADQTGLPNDPELAVRANGALMAISGFMLATGRVPRVAGTLLAASLVPTTVVGHPFWQESDPGNRKAQSVAFQKNLALLGGLLLASVDTEGKPGLTWRARNAARTARREAQLAARSARKEAKLAAAQAKLAVN